MWCQICGIVRAMRAISLLVLCAIHSTFTSEGTDYYRLFNDQVRSVYLTQAVDIIQDDWTISAEPKMLELDEMLHDYVELASQPSEYKDCIPFLSVYSDCSVHNTCLGCSRCVCDIMGKWNCSLVQRCRPEARLPIDHRTLTLAMENLLDEENTLTRKKRSVDEFNNRPKNQDDYFKWTFGISPFDVQDDFFNTSTEDDGNRTSVKIIKEPDHMNFENFLIDVVDVLHNDDENINKTININTNSSTYNNDKGGSSHKSINYLDLVKLFENVNSLTDLTTAQALTERDLHFNDTNNNSDDYQQGRKNDYFYKKHYNRNYKLRNKREGSVNKSTEDVTDKSLDMFINNLTEKTFRPLDNVIKMKEAELSDLKSARDNIVSTVQAYSGLEISNSIIKINRSDVHFIINNYKLSYSDPDNTTASIRKFNSNIIDRYQVKLQHDIREVIKDIAVIQRASTPQKLSRQLKYLVKALRHYIKRQLTQHNPPTNSRRFNFKLTANGKFNPVLALNNILSFLDKDQPESDIGPYLSFKPRLILNRMLRQLQSDELHVLNMKLGDASYSMTKDLNEIARKWELSTLNLNNSAPTERIFKMKVFHLELNKDINTLKDTLIIHSFAERRRMSLISDLDTQKHITDNLVKIHNNINRIVKIAKKPIRMKTPARRSRKKHGFLEKVKKLFKKSKKDIRKILKNKTPKVDTIKQIARKRLDELTKKKLLRYEDTMLRWQDAMNVVRRKRSPNDFNNFMKRIKNIIPGYLHRKVKPAVDFKKSVRSTTAKKVKTHRKHKRRTTRKHVANIMKSTSESTSVITNIR